MKDSRIANVSRRDFLRAGGAASAGLVLGVHVPAFAQMGGAARPAAAAGATFGPNAFVRVGADNTVTVISKHLEMGQGSYTGLATLVAEELDAGWNQMRVEGAPADTLIDSGGTFQRFAAAPTIIARADAPALRSWSQELASDVEPPVPCAGPHFRLL